MKRFQSTPSKVPPPKPKKPTQVQTKPSSFKKTNSQVQTEDEVEVITEKIWDTTEEVKEDQIKR
jgi:hypothetical protein